MHWDTIQTANEYSKRRICTTSCKTGMLLVHFIDDVDESSFRSACVTVSGMDRGMARSTRWVRIALRVPTSREKESAPDCRVCFAAKGDGTSCPTELLYQIEEPVRLLLFPADTGRPATTLCQSRILPQMPSFQTGRIVDLLPRRSTRHSRETISPMHRASTAG